MLQEKDKLKEKLDDIIYFETTGKKKTLANINTLIEEVIDVTNITSINLADLTRGYIIEYVCSDNYKHEIFCYTLTEVIIHLRYLKRGKTW